MFWLSYEYFSMLCNAFLLKSAISSHNSCVFWAHDILHNGYHHKLYIMWPSARVVTKPLCCDSQEDTLFSYHDDCILVRSPCLGFEHCVVDHLYMTTCSFFYISQTSKQSLT